MTTCWLNGRLVAAEEARLSLFDHGLLYGDGVFEGIRFYHRRAFRLDAHLRRLAASARAISLSPPFSHDDLVRAVEAVVTYSDAPEGYLRLGITRGVGPLGLDTGACAQPSCFILSGPLRRLEGEAAARAGGLRLMVAATRRTPPDCLDPRIKSFNYLNNILAREEARRAGCDEAIMLNARGHVAEGASDNLFVVQGGALLTPPVSDGSLDGITRRVVMELAAEQGIPCSERSLTVTDLYAAEECFLTGTAIEMAAAAEIDGRPLQAPGPVFTRLEAAFRRRIDAETRAAAGEGVT